VRRRRRRAQVYALEFVKGRPHLLATGSGESLFLWDHAAGKLLQRLEVESGAVQQGREWRPPGTRRPALRAARRCRPAQRPLPRCARAAAAELRPARPPAFAPAAEGPEPLPAYIFSLAQHPQGSAFAASCSDGVTRVWSCIGSSLALLAELGLHQGMGTACAFSQGGDLLLSGSREGEYVLLVRGWGW
jgi:hypothetical protein